MSIVHRTFFAVCKILERHKISGGSGFQENKAFPLNIRNIHPQEQRHRHLIHEKRAARQMFLHQTATALSLDRHNICYFCSTATSAIDFVRPAIP